MYKTYKVRLYPTVTQATLIHKTFGCVRFVYNQCLAYRIDKYENEHITLSQYETNNYKNRVLKQEYDFLKEVDKYALDNAVIHLELAYKKFFKEHTGFPRFKTKKENRHTYKTNYCNNNIEVDFTNKKIKLPKLKWVKLRGLRDFKGKIKAATIEQTASGKYYCYILVDQEQETALPKTGCSIGLDLGIKDFAVTSEGTKYANPKYLLKSEKKIIKLQKRMFRKPKDSNNHEKARIKFARAWEKVSNQRRDYLQKLSTDLIRNYDVICIENLNVAGLVRNHILAKSISDCSWGIFRTMLLYKADWYGRTVTEIDRFYPSSQTCSSCGRINHKVKDLSVRQWVCPDCGKVHDRDINAAQNILKQGLLAV